MKPLLARGLAALEGEVAVDPDCLRQIASQADGDARRALNLLELAADLAERDILRSTRWMNYYRHLCVVSIRAGMYFTTRSVPCIKRSGAARRMLPCTGFAACWMAAVTRCISRRRVVRMASEDIGNADPRALTLCLDAWQVQERLGSPEGELALAQAIIYLACAAKSNAVYAAYKAARQDVEQGGSQEVPLHSEKCAHPTDAIYGSRRGVSLRPR